LKWSDLFKSGSGVVLLKVEVEQSF